MFATQEIVVDLKRGTLLNPEEIVNKVTGMIKGKDAMKTVGNVISILSKDASNREATLAQHYGVSIDEDMPLMYQRLADKLALAMSLRPDSLTIYVSPIEEVPNELLVG